MSRSIVVTRRGCVGAGLLVGMALSAGLGTRVEAARTRTYSTDSYEAFRKGESSGVILTDDGRVRLGREAALRADPGVRTIWKLASGWGSGEKTGEHGVVLATGNAGLVAACGSGEGEEVRPLATLFDAEVFALCGDGRGNIYAAGAPVGTITRILPAGEARTFFDAPEGVVFALLAAPDGTVYAGTGDRGRLYRISPDGEGKVIHEAPDLALRSLAWAPDGRIWAGSDPRGLVLEIDPGSGQTRVWFDAAEDEIVDLIPLPDGGLLFAANPGAAPGGGDSEVVAAGTVRGESGREGRASSAPPLSKPAVYRMSSDGSVRRLWSCPEDLIHSLALGAEGEIWVATSEEAAIYQVSPEGRESLFWRAKEAQVLSLWRDGDALWAGTGNPGRLYRFTSQPAAEGILTGAPVNAGDQARWGALRWVAVGAPTGLAFETRSGYTEIPDESWSEWTAPRTAGPDQFVTSPPGRYLQWRARFSGPESDRVVLERVDVAAAAINAAPRITSLRISPDEPVFTNPDQGRGGITQVLPNGVQIDYALPVGGGVSVTADDVPQWVRRLRSVFWEALDPDGDELEFTLELRAMGETRWRKLVEDLRERAWTLDQGQLPDGQYEIQLTASDAPGNPESSAFRDVRVTPPFRVDTVPPVLLDVQVRRGDQGIEVSGTASDESSPLRRIEVSLDGENFRWLAPEDGLLDAQVERFSGRVSLPEVDSGEWIVIRAQDGAGNRGLYRAWLEPAAPPR